MKKGIMLWCMLHIASTHSMFKATWLYHTDIGTPPSITITNNTIDPMIVVVTFGYYATRISRRYKETSFVPCNSSINHTIAGHNEHTFTITQLKPFLKNEEYEALCGLYSVNARPYYDSFINHMMGNYTTNVHNNHKQLSHLSIQQREQGEIIFQEDVELSFLET